MTTTWVSERDLLRAALRPADVDVIRTHHQAWLDAHAESPGRYTLGRATSRALIAAVTRARPPAPAPMVELAVDAYGTPSLLEALA